MTKTIINVTSHDNALKRDENYYTNNNSSASSYTLIPRVDTLDRKIISLMISGLSNKQISTELKVPLSTIQRRSRRLVQKEIITIRPEINLERMGFKKGLIHVYISNGNTDQIARRISTLGPVESVEIHIGNSDMIGNVIYRDSKELLQTISDIKRLDGIDKIVWSEEVYDIRNNGLTAKLLGIST
ncbi:MAG TPA: Lrp/AsnC family transcriptional regulator [Nitrososphaeraceae archaeon]|jgi:DNA-binding Lrp family transcriptional regulator|nr:Lrp/AsnC family transcriptional regulator [Nitrososphaeraceae archaeon]